MLFRLLHPNPHGRGGDVRADAVTFNKAQYGIVRYDKFVVADGNFLSGFGEFDVTVAHILFPWMKM